MDELHVLRSLPPICRGVVPKRQIFIRRRAVYPFIQIFLYGRHNRIKARQKQTNEDGLS